MADEEAPHDWNPEREKRQTDPEALARSFVRAAAEEQVKINREMEAKRPRMVARSGPAPRTDLTIVVHEISNGFLIRHGRAPAGYQAIDQGSILEEYVADKVAAAEVVARVLREHFDAPPASSSVFGGFQESIGAEGPVPG